MDQSVELATAYISIVASMQGVRKDVDRTFKGVEADADKAGKKAGKKLGGGLSSGVKSFGAGLFAGIATGKIVGFFKDAVSGASDLEQSVGGVQAVFKDFAPQIEKASKSAAQSLGLTKNEYNELAATLGAGLKNKGIKDFTGQTQNLITLGGDLSATFGGSTKEAVEALSSALRGETDPIERYGIALNQSAIEAEAVRMGLVKNVKDQGAIKKAQNDALVAQRNYNAAVKEHGKNSDEALAAESRMLGATSRLDKVMKGKKVQLTDQQKAQAALSAIQRQSADAQGAFARESDTAAGKQARFKASVDNLKTSLGQQLLPVVSSVAGKANEFVAGMESGTGAGGKFKEIVTQIGGAVKSTVGFLAEHKKVVAGLLLAYAGFRVASATMRAFHAVVLFGKGVQQGYAAATYGATLATKGQTAAEKIGLVVGKAKLIWTKAITVATKAWAVAQRLMNAALRANPIGLVVTALLALGAGLVLLYKKHEGFRNLVNRVWAAIKAKALGVVAWFKDTAWPWMKDVLAKIGAAASDLWSSRIRPAFSKIGAIARSVFGWIKDTGWPWMKRAFALIGGVVKWLWSSVYRPYLGFIWGIVKRVFGWVKNTGWPIMKWALEKIGGVVRWLWSNVAKPYFGFILSKVKSVFGWIKDKGWPAMKWAFSKIAGAVRTAWSSIKGNFERLKSGVTAVKDTFTRVKSAIGKAWSGLTSAISGPIRSALNWINNNFLSKVRSMLKAIGLGDLAKKIPHLSVSVGPSKNGSRPMVSGNMPTKAAGGYIPGPWRGPKADNVLGVSDAGVPVARVNPREYILPVKATERLARQVGRGGLEMLRRGVLPGYAKGGLVGYAMGGDVAGLNPKFKKALDAFNDAVGGRYSVLDGWRSYAEQVVLWNRYKAGTGNLAAYPGTSNHGSGDAADLSPGDAGNRYAALAAKFGLHFPVTSPQWEPWHIELIGGGKGAQKGGPSGVGGALSGLAKKVYEQGAKALNGMLDKIPGGFWAKVAAAPLRMMTKNLAERVKDYGDSYATSALSASSVGSTALAGAGVKRWRSTALKALKITGQPASLVDRLLMQMATESSGNPRAINLTDINARRGDPSKGLMQVIGKTFRTYALAPYNKDIYDPLSNIIASIRYAVATYGSLTRAYQGHGYAGGGLVKPAVFDNGGTLAPGLNLVHNKLGRPEPLIRPEQALSGPIAVNIYDSEGLLMEAMRGEIDTRENFSAVLSSMGRAV